MSRVQSAPFGAIVRAMSPLTPALQALADTWERHTAAEFELKDADAAIATMTDDPVLVHVPAGTGATGREPLRRFYAEIFIPQTPPDATLTLLTRTVTPERLVDEFVFEFTHNLQVDWLVPGIPATGRRVALPHVAVIGFEGDRIASEHIYWDQASMLRQLGVLDGPLPVLGADEQARLLDRDAPANQLISRRS